MMEVLEELNELHMGNLSEEWVQAMYFSEFLEFSDLPPEYENILNCQELPNVFRKIMNCFDNWLNAETNDNEEKSWAILSPNVPYKKLLALLAYYIDYGHKNVSTKEYRNNAVLASCLYYKLLSVPGYKAYHIYHSQLFAHSLLCLSFPKAMCDNEDSYLNSRELSREMNALVKELGGFVIGLRGIIEKLHLTPSDMNFEDILSNLVDITGGAIVNKFSNIDKIELGNVSRVIYEIIDILLRDTNLHPNPDAIQLLFKCLLPKLIAASVDSKNANNIVRASYVTYSGLVLTKYGKAALSGYTILLQHLCYSLDGLERAEVRNARVSLVIGLMSLLPRKSYRQIVKWLLKLSTTSKVSHRQIALEMISKLLSNEAEILKPSTKTVSEEQNVESGNNDSPAPGTSNEAVSTEDESSQDSSQVNFPQSTEVAEEGEEEAAELLQQRAHRVSHDELLRAVYDRVHDVSSTLRTRALAILTQCLDTDHLPMKDAISALNGSGSVSRLMAVCARCVCDERAAVRRAAVTLLHRLLAPRSPLAADDEQPTAHTATDYAILVGLCRDASIIVRTAAITALGELVIQQPNDTVMDAFLSGPMHQVSDPETKIQEQVVTLIQQILIQPLDKYDPNAIENPLPWCFLSGITRNNMRRHLQKTCTLLLKSSNCINHRLVDIASTHLGVKGDERDLQTLLLLTSVARHVDYSDVNFVLDYYYKLTDGSQDEDHLNLTAAELSNQSEAMDHSARETLAESGVVMEDSQQEEQRSRELNYSMKSGGSGRDVRLLVLTLELLTTWSRWLTDEDRAALRDHLVRRLAAAADDGCRTSCASLAAHLDPNNLHWATELLQISERRACAGVNNVEEWVRAADVSLVAPEPPHPRLLDLFLNALNNPPPEWSAAQQGLCVAGAGRLCLRSRAAAAAAAPALAALLTRHDAPLPARHNALLALTDICTRYTCIVEPLLESVCGCLAKTAPAPLRRASARALTKLLLAGYLRLRTPLYYTYCALLADEDHDVREPAEYYVTSCLTVDAIYHHFVDCVMHYNHQDSENLSFDARQLIYDVMLQRMSVVQRLNTQCRLAREVLGHAADVCDETARDELPPPLNAALLDAITLLCGPRMKLPSKKPQNTGDAADIDDLQERITTNIVSHKMKRTVAEVVVPGVLRLYARMRAGGGQLAAYLVRLANDLLADYRTEIEELIENDEELVERISQFQETIGLEPSFGNARNLVTASAPPEPDTPRAPRKRPARSNAHSPRKRALRI